MSRQRSTLPNILLLGIVSLVTLFPLYWLVVYAFRTVPLVMEMPPAFWPRPASLNNFRALFAVSGITRWIVNTLIVSGIVTAANVFFCTLAAYPLAKKEFPGRQLIFWAIICTMMIPPQITWVPLFLILSRLGWLNTYTGLTVPGLASAFGVFLMKQYLSTLPSELLDSAKIDGASEVQCFLHVVIPLAKPGMAVLAIFVFMSTWNSFLWPLIITYTDDMRPLQVGLATLSFEGYQSVGLTYAGAVLSAVPMTLVFFAFQRYFLRGVTVGALKG